MRHVILYNEEFNLAMNMDAYGRYWPEESKHALCDSCGQPDSEGDCNHNKLTTIDVLELGGIPTFVERRDLGEKLNSL